MNRRFSLFICCLAAAATASARITSPKAFFGFAIGDDYMLANYKQYEAYLAKIDAESDRITVVSIGKSEEGREQRMAIISSPANLRRLGALRETCQRLALGRVASQEEARALAGSGKAVVWIDGGLHATEVLGAQQLCETAYRLVSREDDDTRRIREEVVVLLAHANPDGMDLVSDWYMRRADPKERSLAGVPRLYQKYIGHDNNRDFYAANMAETTNISRVLYRDWHPQIVYNHHQTAPAGSIIFAPPFRGPFNYHVDPLAQVATDLVGMAMHARFVAEGKPGAVMRNAASYQTWWNGGLRTTTYFHNMIGILTETFGSPTPTRVPFVANRLVPTTDVPFPIEPQEWKFAQSIEYELTANYAILDFAARYRETLLFNSWRMARNAIDRASADSWTHYPSRVAANGRGEFAALKAPDLRDAKAYVLPADQTDFPTAVKFANMLVKAGVQVHRATRAFGAEGKRFPSGSLVVFCAQAYRAHVVDMFEPQDYPNDFQYPGGPPIPPYDSAGYTPAYTMGVRFERLLEPLRGPLEPVDGFVTTPPGGVTSARGLPAGYLIDPRVNDGFLAANRILAAGYSVHRVSTPVEVPEARLPAGAFFVEEKVGLRPVLDGFAKELGVNFQGLSARPARGLAPVGRARVALLDRYGGSMPSGWTRWILERFEFSFEVVYPPDVERGGLADRYDVLVMTDGMTLGGGPGGGAGGGGGAGQVALAQDETIPAEWRARMGSLTAERSLPAIRAFLESGGTVVCIGSATGLARQLGLPVQDALTETVDGRERRLPRDKFFVPGSVLRMKIDTSNPAAWGMPDYADAMFDDSPAFRLPPERGPTGIKPLAWFDSATPLRSGWAWGQAALQGAFSALEAPVGKGRLLLFGPEVLFRGQTHGTFKLVFNALFA